MKLYFEGVVTVGDEWRCSDDVSEDGAIKIAGRDLVGEISEAQFRGPVTVAIADERYEGPLAVDLGWGYSEYTAMESDKLTVGPHNIIEILERYEGKEMKIWIADEPINTLEAS
jgi:hypothetical protein